MGMDEGSLALLLGQLGAAGISAAAMPDGQELQTFEGEGQLDPRTMFLESKLRINDMQQLLKDRANRGVSVRSGYVQQPPVFTGGGLPMPIGVSGMPPALADPSLLRLGGMAGEEEFPPRDGEPPVIFPEGPDAPAPDDGTPENGPFQRASAGPARRSMPGQSLFAAPNVSEHDDLGRGTGAMELYLRSMAEL